MRHIGRYSTFGKARNGRRLGIYKSFIVQPSTCKSSGIYQHPTAGANSQLAFPQLAPNAGSFTSAWQATNANSDSGAASSVNLDQIDNVQYSSDTDILNRRSWHIAYAVIWFYVQNSNALNGANTINATLNVNNKQCAVVTGTYPTSSLGKYLWIPITVSPFSVISSANNLRWKVEDFTSTATQGAWVNFSVTLGKNDVFYWQQMYVEFFGE